MTVPVNPAILMDRGLLLWPDIFEDDSDKPYRRPFRDVLP